MQMSETIFVGLISAVSGSPGSLSALFCRGSEMHGTTSGRHAISLFASFAS